MKILKIVGFIVLGIILLIVAVGLIAPKKYEFENTILIDAPAEVVYMHVQYWKGWHDWSPWAEKDSTMTISIEGEDGLKGAIYKWTGDPKITGKGEMINTGIVQNQSIDYHLHFIKPWEAHSDGYIRLTEEDGQTKVAWGMYGEMPFPWNIMMIFQPMEKMMEKELDRGLELLKDVVEKEIAAINAFKIEKIKFASTKYVIIRKEVTFGNMQSFFGESYGALIGQLAEAGKQPAGIPGALYYSWDFSTSSADLAAAIPFRGRSPKGMEVVTIKRQTAYQGDYFGPYDKSGIAHWAFQKYFAENGLTQTEPMIELYMNDPTTVSDPSELHTRIIYLVK